MTASGDELVTLSQIKQSLQPRILYSGNFSSGSITIPDLDKYIMFGGEINDVSTRVLGISRPDWKTFRMFGIWYDGSNPQMYSLNCSRSGNTLTMVDCVRCRLDNSTIDKNRSLTVLYGLVPIGSNIV